MSYFKQALIAAALVLASLQAGPATASGITSVAAPVDIVNSGAIIAFPPLCPDNPYFAPIKCPPPACPIWYDVVPCTPVICDIHRPWTCDPVCNPWTYSIECQNRVTEDLLKKWLIDNWLENPKKVLPPPFSPERFDAGTLGGLVGGLG